MTNIKYYSKDRQSGGNYTLAAFGTCSMKGHYRDSQEDRYLNHEYTDGTSFFGVFDGHGGSDCAQFLQDNLLQYLGDLSNDQCIQRDFLRLDADFAHKKAHNDPGTTAVLAIVTRNQDGHSKDVTLCNVGDSRCAVYRASTSQVNRINKIKISHLQSTIDHKPTLPQETKRIQEADGFVLYNRVNAMLATSRAFGDYMFKNNTKVSQDKQPVTAEPEIIRIRACERGIILVVACDGLWDVYTEEQVAALLEEDIKENISLVDMARRLCSNALSKGSRDNVTATIVFIK